MHVHPSSDMRYACASVEQDAMFADDFLVNFFSFPSTECDVMAVLLARVHKMRRDVYSLCIFLDCDAVCYVIMMGSLGSYCAHY